MRIFLLFFVPYGLDYPEFLRVVPFHAKKHYNNGFEDVAMLLENLKEEFKDINADNFIVPFLDFRLIHGNVQYWLEKYSETGFQGLKSLFLPEYDNFLQVESPIDVLGISKKKYLSCQCQVFEFANDKNIPVIFHLNLNNHFEFASEILTDFPQVRVNIPHFGFSRRIISKLFEKHENCYTDISGLRKFIEMKMKDYSDFIEHYNDRIMFGTDCPWNEAIKINDYFDLVDRMPLSEKVKSSLLYGTAVKFLGNPT